MKGASWPHEIDPSDLLKYNIKISSLYSEFKAKSEEVFGRICSVKPHLLSEKLYRLAITPSVISKVKDYIGPDVNIWSSALFVKPANTKKYVGYHQDSPYWQLSTTNVVTAWIALSESKRYNGCLEFVESQLTNKKIYPLDVENAFNAYNEGEKTSRRDDLISFNQIIPASIISKNIHYVELMPAQFSLHKIDIIHGSPANNSSVTRIGFAVRYVDSNTSHNIDKKDGAVHVCGNRSKYLVQETPPKGEFSASSLQMYKEGVSKAGAFGNKQY